MTATVKGSGAFGPAAAGGGRAADGRSARWSSHRAARREEFIDAAVRVAAEHGPDLRIALVAAEAGVTKPVLYRQFADKADLLDAVQQRLTRILLDRLMPALTAPVPPVARVRGALDAFFSMLEDYPHLLSRPGDATPTGRARVAAALTGVYGERLRALGLGTRGAEAWAHATVGMVHGTAQWWGRERPMTRTEVVDQLTAMVWAAVDGYLRQHGVVLDPATTG
ncbi:MULTISPECIES: TetR/AcrR family transcriptional regulator [Streptomycetaceae]|uniref:Transcriptional regulator, TetR family protein n=1 Tax=Streptantibioticus cattleyicolor (strain ATCC 35852 / DSM 46488 / JCM 4925 / NBRC 14057 / NRRL 8057) TaxID=1003195 RepID=F8K1T5_STREN|nr:MULTISPECIES: TetR family transcriptional regulator [Streptomycetaceae]AEW92404.1 transcriptional regulator, TetR family protein [Streptantibioticus cattleyicolor NRRL 8057 = DSM 46488]MYS57215.1 TetR family transcriptional regulator [Streptomyces sp. SID5468]CCB72769.1 Transcriptional regulator, TetR family [Streptantibioticus cattleyicolor NRRL 8057 = DSM 46488]